MVAVVHVSGIVDDVPAGVPEPVDEPGVEVVDDERERQRVVDVSELAAIPVVDLNKVARDRGPTVS